MKIIIELKNGTYTITYGKLTGQGETIEAAVAALTLSFKSNVEQFFHLK